MDIATKYSQILGRRWIEDQFGNYWLDDNRKLGPAIFPHKTLDRHKDDPEKHVLRTGTFTAFRGPDKGFIVDKTGFRVHYQSPVEAAKAMGQP